MFLEKALGVAQLCLLLVTLVFVALTRGYQGESFVEHGSVMLNKWSKRHLSFSGPDWMSKLKSSSQKSPDASGNIVSAEQDVKIEGLCIPCSKMIIYLHFTLRSQRQSCLSNDGFTLRLDNKLEVHERL